MSLPVRKNQDWITEYDWYLEDGRSVDNLKGEHVYWYSHRTPFGVFKN
jgi:hypothetical protein